MITEEAVQRLIKKLESPSAEIYMHKANVINMIKYAAGIKDKEPREKMSREEFMRQEPW